MRHAELMRDMSGLLVKRSDVVSAGGDTTTLEREARRGLFVRVAPGAYVSSETWRSLDLADQHATRVHAVVPRLAPDVVVSHESALVVHGFPLLGRWPERVHVVAPRRERDKVDARVHQHAVTLAADEIEDVDGLRVVVSRRAAVDAVRRRDLRGAAVVLDHGLRTGAFTRAELEAAVAARRGAQGSRRAAVAVAFADGRAESPGESLSRAVIHGARLTRPVLQARFPEVGPLVGVVDFWWPEFGVVGEFDGDVKYRDASLRRGRSPEQVVIDEKRREDALRAMPDVRTVVRWTWADALRSEPLLRALARAGVR